MSVLLTHSLPQPQYCVWHNDNRYYRWYISSCSEKKKNIFGWKRQTWARDIALHTIKKRFWIINCFSVLVVCFCVLLCFVCWFIKVFNRKLIYRDFFIPLFLYLSGCINRTTSGSFRKRAEILKKARQAFLENDHHNSLLVVQWALSWAVEVPSLISKW